MTDLGRFSSFLSFLPKLLAIHPPLEQTVSKSLGSLIQNYVESFFYLNIARISWRSLYFSGNLKVFWGERLQFFYEEFIVPFSKILTAILVVLSGGTLFAQAGENKAISWIEKLGGTMVRDDKAAGRPVVSVNLDNTPISNADLKIIAMLPQLQQLSLVGPLPIAGLKELVHLKALRMLGLYKITDADLKGIAALKQLQRLTLIGPLTAEGFKELAHLKNMQELDFSNTQDAGEGLKSLVTLPSLKRLSWAYAPISADGLKQICRFEHLCELSFFCVPLTNEQLKETHSLRELQKLELIATAVTDAGLKHLASLKKLRELSLDSTPITDVGVKELARQRQWRTLSFADCKITDAAVVSLASQKQLTGLDLSSNPVTDACMPLLAKLKQLHWLTLQQAQITDQGLKYLASLKELRNLDLGGSRQVSANGIRNLRKALPKCAVEWTPPIPQPPPLISLSLTTAIFKAR